MPVMSIAFITQQPFEGKSGDWLRLLVEGAALRHVSEGTVLASELAVFLEDLGPVLDQEVERLLGGALVRHDIVVDARLHRLHQLRVGRLSPEIDDFAHGDEEVGREGRRFREAASFSTPLWQV